MEPHSCKLESLNAVRIPRCYFDLNLPPTKIQLHAFSDGSSKAYAVMVYTRSIYDNGDVKVWLVASKSRIVPRKTQSIPRLELLGTTILARLIHTVVVTTSKNMRIFYWVDTMTVLCWIKNDKILKQYTSHQVEEIKRLSNRDDWRYCPATSNPADLPSRGDVCPIFMDCWNVVERSFVFVITWNRIACLPGNFNHWWSSNVELVKHQPSIVRVLPVSTTHVEIWESSRRFEDNYLWALQETKSLAKASRVIMGQISSANVVYQGIRILKRTKSA